MLKFEVTYFDAEGDEHEVTVKADDEAAALGCVLDEHGDDIPHGAPFAVCLKQAPKRSKRSKKKIAGAKVVPMDDDITKGAKAKAAQLFKKLGLAVER